MRWLRAKKLWLKRKKNINQPGYSPNQMKNTNAPYHKPGETMFPGEGVSSSQPGQPGIKMDPEHYVGLGYGTPK